MVRRPVVVVVAKHKHLCSDQILLTILFAMHTQMEFAITPHITHIYISRHAGTTLPNTHTCTCNTRRLCYHCIKNLYRQLCSRSIGLAGSLCLLFLNA